MVAIDIGTDSVHAVEVTFSPEPRIVKRGSTPLTAPVWEDLAAHRDAMSAAIRAALTAGGISATQVVTAIPRRMATLKYARLPHAEPSQIRSMVEFEAQQYVPFPIEDVVLDHQIVSDEMDEMTTVMIVAARLSLVETLLSIFDKAGLEVSHISVSALALAEHARGTALPVALLEADGPELDLAVVSADKLLFSRAASLNGSRGVATSQAEQLTAEIARSLAAYQNEHRSAPVSRILIAGRGGALTDVESALDGLLDIPVGPLTSSLLPAGDPTAATYAVATGLALQGAGGGISTIDLVPASRMERKEAARQRTNTIVAMIAVAAVLVLAGVYISGMLAAQAKELKDAQRENRKLEIAKSALTRVNGEFDRVKKNYEAASAGMGRNKPMVDVVKAVSDAVPKSGGIYLTQLSFERGSSLSIHGNAANETAATDLVLALQASGAFKDVRLNYLGDNSTDISATASGASRAAARAAGASSSRTQPAAGSAGGTAAARTGTTTSPAPGPDIAAGTKPKPEAAAMSFLVTCRVYGSEPKELSDKPARRTTTASTAGETRSP